MRRAPRWPALVLLALVAGCGTGDSEGTVRVLAASSLTDAFETMAQRFEAGHPGIEVSLTFAASSALVQQVAAGAPAAVVATADDGTMRAMTDDGDVGASRVFARNRLAILVGKGNPEDITGLADLARPGVVTVLCAPEVPCGRLARAALRVADVDLEPASREQNVRSVAAKVVLGEADAGIVYVTEALAEGDRAHLVEIDVAAQPELEAVYSIAPVRRADNPAAARAWVDFVLSGEGQAVLRQLGFLPP